MRSDTGEVWLRFLVSRFLGAKGFELLVATLAGDAPLNCAGVAVFGAAVVWLIYHGFEVAAADRLTEIAGTGVEVVAV